MNTPQKKSTPSIKKSELPKFNKALSKLITNSKKQSSDVLTLSSLIELKYDVLENLKPVDVVGMLQATFNITVSPATFRNGMKKEKAKREIPVHKTIESVPPNEEMSAA